MPKESQQDRSNILTKC